MNNQLIKKSMVVTLTLVTLLLLVAPAMAQENTATPGGNVPTAPTQGQGPTRPAVSPP